MSGDDPCEIALSLFVALAKAQPFGDGNKRTALFVANAVLLGAGAGKLFTVPVDEDGPGVADTFNNLLARAYVLDEPDGVKDMLRGRGLADLPG